MSRAQTLEQSFPERTSQSSDENDPPTRESWFQWKKEVDQLLFVKDGITTTILTTADSETMIRTWFVRGVSPTQAAKWARKEWKKGARKSRKDNDGSSQNF